MPKGKGSPQGQGSHEDPHVLTSLRTHSSSHRLTLDRLGHEGTEIFIDLVYSQ